MITPKYIDEELFPAAKTTLKYLKNIGRERFNVIAPNLNYDHFDDFSQGCLAGIEYIKQSMIHSTVYEGNFEWTKGDFIQKQGEV